MGYWKWLFNILTEKENWSSLWYCIKSFGLLSIFFVSCVTMIFSCQDIRLLTLVVPAFFSGTYFYYLEVEKC